MTFDDDDDEGTYDDDDDDEDTYDDNDDDDDEDTYDDDDDDDEDTYDDDDDDDEVTYDNCLLDLREIMVKNYVSYSKIEYKPRLLNRYQMQHKFINMYNAKGIDFHVD